MRSQVADGKYVKTQPHLKRVVRHHIWRPEEGVDLHVEEVACCVLHDHLRSVGVHAHHCVARVCQRVVQNQWPVKNTCAARKLQSFRLI